MQKYIKWFSELRVEDVAQVGGKNANLGEMYHHLNEQGIRIPNGYAITAEAYRAILAHNGAIEKLHALLDDLNPKDIQELQKRGAKARQIVLECEIPPDIKSQIKHAYKQLKEEYGEDLSLAVRSSATAEDSLEASFAGQNESYLNVRGFDELLEKYLHCIASNFNDRSIDYKHNHGFDYLEVDVAVVIMKMVRSDLGASGVMFSIDTESGFDKVVFINGALGLGENIVQGTIDPDSFWVYKPTLEKGYRTVLKKRLGHKTKKMVFSDHINDIKNIDTTEEEQNRYCLSDEDVVTLAEYAVIIEKHYSANAGVYRPMDMEWAKDGIDGKLYIVQARPETVKSKADEHLLEQYQLLEKGKELISGRAVGMKIAQGKVRIIHDVKKLHEFQEGDIIVADITSPDWEPIMKKASALVTNRGGRTCHAAIVARELGIPAIVATHNATEVLKDGDDVTICCSEGEEGIVYEGVLEYKVNYTDLRQNQATKTKMMINLGNPSQAFSLAWLPVDGIGLARMEFIISTLIKAHPMALKHPEQLDRETRGEIAKLTAAYDSPEEFFVQRLSEGVATIASSVYPKPCVVRMSDFKTNEYASLLGGSVFEPEEENPMLGFRGAVRYTDPQYAEGFALECRAMKRVREEMGFENVILMIPFCRRIDEGKRVLESMAAHGLKQGENGLKIYVMCEIPNNVILIDEFSQLFDGFSIGSNDLAQLTLGVDRDSALVAASYDERDEGVMKMIEMAVVGAKRNNRPIGICGQGPSDYPEMAEKLIAMGIDSMSLTPDSVLGTIEMIKELEEKTE